MKSNNKIIVTAAIALAAGLAVGFILFGGRSGSSTELADRSSKGLEDNGKAQVWTCSMHPQIRQNEPGLCPICEMDLIPLGSNISSDPLVLEMTDEAVRLAQVETSIIETQNTGGKEIRLSGKVTEDERLAFSQVAHIPGRVEKLFVTFTGEQVSRGQKLATIYSPELITAQRELIEAYKLRSSNLELHEAARNKLLYWKINEEDISTIEETGQIRETFTVYAEQNGVVRNRRVTVGDYVKKGEVLFELSDLSRVWVLFDAYEKDLPFLREGHEIDFSAPSIPGRTFRARVTFIDPVIDAKTRVISLRTEVNNPYRELKPEMLVTGTYKEGRGPSEKLIVPKSAVLWTGRRSVVYLKVPDAQVPTFQYREVELGDDLGESYVILGGLDRGDEVVTNGSFSIDAAAQLNNQASMMNQDVNVKGGVPELDLPDFSNEVSVEFKNQLAGVSRDYLRLKDAFVASDAKIAKEEARLLLSSLTQVDMSLIKGEAHQFWMEHLRKLRSHSELIADKEDVEDQRKQFEFLSESMIHVVQAFGTSSDSLYVQHCPMAFDNNGADWLSDAREIRNPYFGSKMLKCGLVKNAIGSK